MIWVTALPEPLSMSIIYAVTDKHLARIHSSGSMSGQQQGKIWSSESTLYIAASRASKRWASKRCFLFIFIIHAKQFPPGRIHWPTFPSHLLIHKDSTAFQGLYLKAPLDLRMNICSHPFLKKKSIWKSQVHAHFFSISSKYEIYH